MLNRWLYKNRNNTKCYWPTAKIILRFYTLALSIDDSMWREVVKGFVGYLKFNLYNTALATNLFKTIPSYIFISIIVFCFLLLIGIFAFAFYYTYRKFKAIDNHTNRKYSNRNKDENITNPNTYKEDMKEYEQDVDGLDAKIVPDGQTVSNAADKVVEFIKGIRK